MTSRFYTDLSLLTANPEVTEAVQDVFTFLTAYSERPHYDPLQVAPVDLSERTLALIQRETDHARYKRPARIIAKMNSLLDKAVIQALYKASQAGVQIDLIVRGMCALRPEVRGISDRIRVRSIVGRLLEHSRIFWFGNDGKNEVYLGSADLMHRNLNRRVEVLFPVEDPQLRARAIKEFLENAVADNTKIRWLQPDGTYQRVSPAAAERRNFQEELMAKYQAPPAA